MSPGGIDLFDESNLFVPPPALQLFLSSDGVANIPEGLEIDEFLCFVFFREARNESGFVFGNAPLKEIRDADVKGAGFAGHNVKVRHRLDVTNVLALTIWHLLRRNTNNPRCHPERRPDWVCRAEVEGS